MGEDINLLMKSLLKFIVHLPKKMNDTVKLNDDIEISIDTRFNEFEYRKTSAEVLSVPCKYSTEVKEGDTLYFHHLVVLNEGTPLTGVKDSYLVQYDPCNCMNSQCIAYKSKETGEIFPMSGWSILEYVEEDDEISSDHLDVVTLGEKFPRKGMVSFDAPWLEELGVKKGDIVGFPKNMDYRIKIDNKEYYRVDPSDLLYVEC